MDKISYLAICTCVLVSSLSNYALPVEFKLSLRYGLHQVLHCCAKIEKWNTHGKS